MRRQPAEAYDVIRLHSRAENAWAVIEKPSGAIALDAQARLLMRMLRKDALRTAKALSFAMAPAALLDPVEQI